MRVRAGKEALKRRQATALENLNQHIKKEHLDGKKDEPHKSGRKGSMEAHKKELAVLNGIVKVETIKEVL